MDPQVRVGLGHDLHRLHPNAPLTLGGVNVPADRGFDTHTDGDVVVHAVIDAIAGAMVDGNVGTHFPDDDPATADSRSIELLAEFAEYVRSQGYTVYQVDVVLILGKVVPLHVHVPDMQREVAHALGIALERVSIKPRSNDGVGPEGTGEAASATAVAMLSAEPGH